MKALNDDFIRFVDNMTGVQRLGELMACARKRKGISIDSLATQLSVNKHRINEWESNYIEPKILEWRDISRALKIDFTGVEFPYLEFFREKEKAAGVAMFNLPAKYIDNPTVSVRWLVPFFLYLEFRKGKDGLHHIFSELGVDPHYFYCYNHSVNIRFVFDFLSIVENELPLNNLIAESSQLSACPVGHGALSTYLQKVDDNGLLPYLRLFNYFYDEYDSSFDYSFVEYCDDLTLHDSIFISFAPRIKFSSNEAGYVEKMINYRTGWLSNLVRTSDIDSVPKIAMIECDNEEIGESLYEIAV